MSASRFSVVYKDDTLGLGAGRGVKENETTTGIDGFQDLLSRLNGKVRDKIENGAKDIDEARQVRHLGRWGSTRFVSGGFLLGDALQVQPEQEEVIRAGQDVDTEIQDHGSVRLEASCLPAKVEVKYKATAQKRIEKVERRLRRQRRRDPTSAVQGPCRPLESVIFESTESQGTITEDLKKTLLPEGASARQSSGDGAGGRRAARQRFVQQKKMVMLDAKALNEVKLRFAPSFMGLCRLTRTRFS